MIKVRNVTIGEGIPKIIVPLVGGSNLGLLEEVQKVIELKPDIVEWRVDTYENMESIEAVRIILSKLRDRLNNIPLLFTCRSFKEGGKRDISVEYYAKLIRMSIQSKFIDMVDIELFQGDEFVKGLVTLAKENGVYVVMSNHDFQGTPNKEEIITRLRKMQEMGADIPKIAVMPTSAQDVISLLDATNKMKHKYPNHPFITVSMGKLGLISRIAGEVFGSVATFGSGIEESAPGQLNARELRSILAILHKSN